jgi:NADH/F420H2 dehydrogenase subunit C
MNNKFITNFNNIFKKYNLSITVDKDDFTLETTPKDLENVLFFLRDHESCLFKMLIDILVIDYPEKEKRFSLIYCFLSVKYNVRIKVKIFLDELTPVPSITNIYKSACWMEREVWDMNGVFFENHPDLRRILTDYGFEGFPLRKDFPLSGYTEVRYDDSQKRVISESIEMSQEYRVFNFKSSWE